MPCCFKLMLFFPERHTGLQHFILSAALITAAPAATQVSVALCHIHNTFCLELCVLLNLSLIQRVEQLQAFPAVQGLSTLNCLTRAAVLQLQ